MCIRDRRDCEPWLWIWLSLSNDNGSKSASIKNKIENIDEYETMYVGYPNWWGEMPMILYTFFEDYDLSNKTITLFCTSGESGLSDTCLLYTSPWPMYIESE